MEKLVSRWAHNPKVTGSSPVSAPIRYVMVSDSPVPRGVVSRSYVGTAWWKYWECALYIWATPGFDGGIEVSQACTG